MITPEIQKVIDYYGLSFSGRCRDCRVIHQPDIMFVNATISKLMGVIVGPVEVTNDNLYKELTIQFEICLC